MPSTILTILLLAGLFILALALPTIRLRRALRAVIKIFQKHNAVDAMSAKTKSELGFRPKSLLERAGTVRDFRPHALQVLIEARIVRVTEEEKLYLSEEDLAASRLSKYASNG
jgi:hypothetical protein